MTYTERFKNVRLMHETMLSMNNEDAYMDWIWTMPDEPSDDDFEWFAADEKEYNELHIVFQRIMLRYMDDGLYKPNPEVVEYVQKCKIPIEILT